MANFDYSKICLDLLSGLKERERETISRRFGLSNTSYAKKGNERETLESIGQDFGICRERVRQIEEAGFEKIRTKIDNYQNVFKYFLQYLKKFGDLRREEILLSDLGGKWKNEIYFLLSLQQPFQRISQNKDFYSLWLVNPRSLKLAQKSLIVLTAQLQKQGKPLPLEALKVAVSLRKEVLTSFLEISKKIQKNEENLYGLKEWPEINPKGIKDKAYLVLKKAGKPLHFAKVADLIERSHLQTVHNELIRDQRFVLVGRGTYALKEWGYYPGEVKDVISKVLKESEKALTREEILNKVLSQRIVKENTILLNLGNKKYFLKDSQGKYRPRTELI